jgi:hypothetical protein
LLNYLLHYSNHYLSNTFLLYITTQSKMPAVHHNLFWTYVLANVLDRTVDDSKPMPTPLEVTKTTMNSSQVARKKGKAQPASKASTDPTDVATVPQPKLSTAKGKHYDLPHHSPNPVCASHVANPGAPDMKHSKQTTVKVEEAAKHKKDAHLCLQMLEQEKIEILAKMEVNEELKDEEEECTAVKDITDTMSNGISEFVKTEAESISNSEDVAIVKELPLRK